MWAFWIACGLAAIGAVTPFVASAGGHNRMAGVIVPFGIASVALAVNALQYHRGRPIAAALYFIAGLAIVYGILAMVTVPLRLAVVGTCPLGSAPCPAGYEQPLTSGESDAFTIATVCGMLAIFTGFYGLLMLYRRRRAAARQEAALWPAQPPDKSSAPATPKPAEAPAAAHIQSKPETKDEAKKLAAHEEPKELPAPSEPKELSPPA